MKKYLLVVGGSSIIKDKGKILFWKWIIMWKWFYELIEQFEMSLIDGGIIRMKIMKILLKN